MDISPRTRQVRQASHGWLVQRLATRFEAAMAEALREPGLSVAQFAVLMRVLEQDGQTQTEIGAGFAMPAWAVSRALDGLEGAGLVTRRRCPQSRRSQRVCVTEAGRALAPRLHALIGAVNDRVLAPLEPHQRDRLHRLLTRLEVGDTDPAGSFGD